MADPDVRVAEFYGSANSVYILKSIQGSNALPTTIGINL